EFPGELALEKVCTARTCRRHLLLEPLQFRMRLADASLYHSPVSVEMKCPLVAIGQVVELPYEGVVRLHERHSQVLRRAVDGTELGRQDGLATVDGSDDTIVGTHD